jgi:predicted transcriptional regulator
MENNYISQIPVRDKATKKFLGVISEKLIMSYITDRGPSSVNDKISKMQLEKLEIISSDLQLPEIEHLLQKTSVLLVRLKKEKFGIITKSDLLQYYKN